MPARSSRPSSGDPPLLHVLYDNISESPAPPLTMLGYSANRQNTQFHLFPLNPYPSPPQPPPIAHKVWILDCKSCDTFLTNRGMKAVLLLRPNVSLYSSDALPVNCSAYTSNPEALRPPSTCRPPSSSHAQPRTCECLTQTLCCHGCGSTIGYMIVIPCTRCTSSITTNNRATNGHRFVFHSSEIVATERHYIEGEPGVIPYDPVPTTLALESSAQQFLYPPAPTSYASSHSSHRPQEDLSRSRSSSPESLSDYLPTPPLEFANPSLISSRTDSFPFPPQYAFPDSNTLSHLTSQGSLSRFPPSSYHVYSSAQRSGSPAPDVSSSPPLARSSLGFDGPAEQKEQPTVPRRLLPGDNLFWHHLARNGEIPGVQEDPRARSRQASTATATVTAGSSGKIAATLAFGR